MIAYESSFAELTEQLSVISARLCELAARDPAEAIARPVTESERARALLQRIAGICGLGKTDLTRPRPRGFRSHVLARQIACYLLRKDLFLTYHDIQRLLCYNDHTTCMYAYNKIAALQAAGDERVCRILATLDAAGNEA